MRQGMLRQLLVLGACVLLLLGVVFVFSAPAEAATAANDGNALGQYLPKPSWPTDPNQQPWLDIWQVVLTDEVKQRLGGEEAAKQKLMPLIIDAANLPMLNSQKQLLNAMEQWIAKHPQTFSDLGNGDITTGQVEDFVGTVQARYLGQLASRLLVMLQQPGWAHNSMSEARVSSQLRKAISQAAGQTKFQPINQWISNDLELGSCTKMVDVVDILFKYKRGMTLKSIWSFQDIDNHWAKSSINNMVTRSAIQGVSDEQFEPERAITKAEFCTLLFRSLDLQLATEPKVSFNDVAAGDWYYPGIMAAVDNGLISARSGQSFQPNAVLTRQEMASMLARAAALEGKGVTLSPAQVNAQLVRFRDQNQIQNWARSDVAAALKLGLIQGRPDGTFAPYATSTRAEAAVVLERLLTLVE